MDPSRHTDLLSAVYYNDDNIYYQWGIYADHRLSFGSDSIFRAVKFVFESSPLLLENKGRTTISQDFNQTFIRRMLLAESNEKLSTWFEQHVGNNEKQKNIKLATARFIKNWYLGWKLLDGSKFYSTVGSYNSLNVHGNFESLISCHQRDTTLNILRRKSPRETVKEKKIHCNLCW